MGHDYGQFLFRENYLLASICSQLTTQNSDPSVHLLTATAVKPLELYFLK